MRELIELTHHDWATAKATAARSCAASGKRDYARALDACCMFHGDEDLAGLAELIFSPRGIEFMTTFDFPTLDTFRKYLPYHPEQYGIYIDAGDIVLDGEKRAFLVGNTRARVNYHECAAHLLFLMKGATAEGSASGYAVVKIEKDAQSEVNINVTEFAKVL